jgi:hypothetical protein
MKKKFNYMDFKSKLLKEIINQRKTWIICKEKNKICMMHGKNVEENN